MHIANYVFKSFPYELKVSHNTSITEGRTERQTDRQKDGRQLIPIARP